MAQRRAPLLQLILGGLFAFLFARLLIGLVRALLGHSGPREGRLDASEARHAAAEGRPGQPTSGARRPPRIDRSSAIDVPFTEIPLRKDTPPR